MRSGRYVMQATGYRAFIPAPLPPTPAIHFDSELIALNSTAERMLARLDTAASLVPNQDLFILMHALREAVLSSQIEGTQSSLDDLLRVEARLQPESHPDDVHETFNYREAMTRGFALLAELPVSLRLIREIHATLMRGVRGADRQPGEFRRSQNWIGPAGSTLASAAYVPPPPEEMAKSLGELETFLHSSEPIPPLVKSGLVHAQFETIHAFLDGNGRVGRLLITFLLVESGILRKPVLYPSLYFKQNRSAYYDHLQAVRDQGAWEAWLKFYLTAIGESARDGFDRMNRVIQLREEHRRVLDASNSSSRMLRTLEQLYVRPYTTVSDVAREQGVTFAAANKMVANFVKLGVLREISGRRRSREYEYQAYLDILRQETVGAP